MKFSLLFCLRTIIFVGIIADNMAKAKNKTSNDGIKHAVEPTVGRRGFFMSGFFLPRPGVPGPKVKVTNDSGAIIIELSKDGGQDNESMIPQLQIPIKPWKCSKERSCFGRCTHKRQFQNLAGEENYPTCFCDPECNSVFHDCCADYKKLCNSTRFHKELDKNDLNSRLKCFEMEGFRFRVWMIGECDPGWPIDEVRPRCTDISKGFARLVSELIPVIDKNNNTFRNRFCAQCNHVKNITLWKFTGVRCPPKLSKDSVEVSEEISFLDNQCSAEKINFTAHTSAVRYCYNLNKECNNQSNQNAVKNCETGTTGLVSFQNKTYRNFDCLMCSYTPEIGILPLLSYCGPRLTSGKRIIPFASMFKTNSLSFPNSRCPQSYFYDSVVRHCRKLMKHQEEDLKNQLRKYSFRLKYTQREIRNYTCIADDNRAKLKDSTSTQLRKQFIVAFKRTLLKLILQKTSWQLSNLNVHVSNNTDCFVNFEVLGIPSENERNLTTSVLSSWFQINDIYFYFIPNDDSRVCKYSLLQAATLEMNCLENTTFILDKPELLSQGGAVFVNETQEYYTPGQYLMYQYKNITKLAICKNFKSANCSYYLDIKNKAHWIIFPNGSIYTDVTASWFHYGEYSIVNGTLWLCLTKEFVRNSNRIPRNQSVHYDILSYITLVTLTISIIALVTVLTVYSLFPSLRNVPGKNLMLLCAVLAIGQLFWLLQEEIHSLSSTLCVITSVALQYFFLASFCCAGSIAFHSFITFSAIAKGKLGQPTGGRTFRWCALYGLGFPLLLVTIFWLLDLHEIVLVGYGDQRGHCWLGNGQAKGIYLAFFGPVFTLLFFNFIFLFATIKMIHKCKKGSQKLAEKTQGQSGNNIGIYLRMSTVMGFTWLFGLFQLVFPKIVAFEYLFVLVNGLQGFYIAVAFLFTDNVRKMSKKLLRFGSVSTTQITGKSKS